jgi:hypothetical protein
VAPYYGGNGDLYFVEPMCAFTGNTTIPVYLAGMDNPELQNPSYQRCAGSRFTVNIDFSNVDAWPQLIATANEGFDAYNNQCYPSQFWMKRNGCSGYNCSTTFYFSEYATDISPFTFTCPSGQSWYTGVSTSSGSPAPNGCYTQVYYYSNYSTEIPDGYGGWNLVYLVVGGSPTGFTPAYYTRSVTVSFQLPHMIQVQ